jgi:DNA-binding NtrC family response regulator
MSIEMTRRRVVIIEDEGMVAMLLEDMLTELGHEVVAIVGKMDRAAQLISETSADVVVLDVNLNGEQTYPLASALASRGIPFVFSTGYGSAGLKKEWIGRPALQKPFRAQDLERAMRQAFGNSLDRAT